MDLDFIGGVFFWEDQRSNPLLWEVQRISKVIFLILFMDLLWFGALFSKHLGVVLVLDILTDVPQVAKYLKCIQEAPIKDFRPFFKHAIFWAEETSHEVALYEVFQPAADYFLDALEILADQRPWMEQEQPDVSVVRLTVVWARDQALAVPVSALNISSYLGRWFPQFSLVGILFLFTANSILYRKSLVLKVENKESCGFQNRIVGSQMYVVFTCLPEIY